MLAGIEDACRSRQVNLYYATLPVDDDNLPTDIPRLLSEDTIDGLLLVGAFVDATLEHILGRGILPVVLVDAYADTDPYDAVVSDNVRGAYMAVKHLLAHGHYHIGMIGGRSDAYPSLRQRRTGYLQALRDAGVTVSYVVDAAYGNVAEATTSLLTKHPHITALFAMNDEAAIAAMRAAQAMGRTTPAELSIVGFDDIELARHAIPALTTMHVDKIAMGRIAVQMLENRLAYPSSEQVTTVLRPRLIERESVADIS
ncbi:MAG: substrate-binding domain-containing protein [Anaerolineales bacterium]|nr:substrate-binding domain-containing protein [Anaerolineales bacterium]